MKSGLEVRMFASPGGLMKPTGRSPTLLACATELRPVAFGCPGKERSLP